MKIIYWLPLALIFLTSTVRAQEATDTVTVEGPTSTYTERQDSILQHLDKSRIPYGILYNRVFPFTSLDSLQSTDTLDFSYFNQALSELQRSSYDTTADSILDYRKLDDFVFSENMQQRIPILSLDAAFAHIDSNSLTDGRLNQEGGFVYDGDNPASPYITDSVHFAVLGLRRPIDSGSTYELKMSDGYSFGNSSLNPSSITIENLTTGQSWDFSNGSKESITFTQTGSNVFRITLANEVLSRVYYQIIGIRSLSKGTSLVGDCTGPITPIIATIPFQGYDETSPIYGKGEFQIFYSVKNGCSQKLNKPIVISDAYDPDDIRKIQDIYEGKLVYDVGLTTHYLADELRNDGYDIVILNYPNIKTDSITYYLPRTHQLTTAYTYRHGGVDYNERNGLLFVQLLQQLKDSLAANNSQEKFAVVGPSQGGQITRYALKYMEDNNLDHNTRLWFSFDSPHWGANIPFGMQDMIRYLYKSLGNKSAENFYNGQLRAPSSRQMLIHQTYPDYKITLSFFQNYNNTLNFYKALNNQDPFRVSWRNTLNTIGFPSNLRKVAIINGTYKGGQYHVPGDEMLFLHVKNHADGGGRDMVLAHPYFINTVSTKVSDVWAWGLFGSTSYSMTTAPSLPYGALDACPGGMYDVQQEFYDATNNSSSTVFSFAGYDIVKVKAFVEHLTHNISFIPSVSSLAMTNPNFDWRTPFSKYGMLCNSGTPFDNVFIPEQNEGHIHISEESANWIKEELAYGTSSNCSPICPSQNWPDFLCDGQTFNLSLSGVPVSSQYNITWEEVDPNNNYSMSISSDKLTATITTHHNYQQGNIIRARITNPCGGHYLIEKEFTIPTTLADINGPSILYQNTGTYSISGYPAGSTLNWYFGDNNGIYDDVNPYGTGIHAPYSTNAVTTFGGTRTGTYTVYCDVTLPAASGGCTLRTNMQVEIQPRGNHKSINPALIDGNLLAKPNPSATSWDITFDNSKADVSLLTITDIDGKQVYTTSIVANDKHKEVSCLDLPSGIYVCKIYRTDGTFSILKLQRL